MRQQSCGAVWRGHQEGASFMSVTESHVWGSLNVGHVSMKLWAGRDARSSVNYSLSTLVVIYWAFASMSLQCRRGN